MKESYYKYRYFSRVIFAFLLFCIPQHAHSTIKVLYTAAIIDKHYKMRMDEYIYSLKTLQAFGYEPYIVESVKSHGPTFFDEYAKYICYTGTSNPRLRNKGVNEFISIAKAFEKYQFDDDDMIVKISGRCYFACDMFLKNIEKKPEIDAFVKYDRNRQVFTGCFALRAKYFKELLANIDFQAAERHMINLERIVADHIIKMSKQGAHIEEIFEVGMIAHYFGDGNIRVLTYR